MMAEDEDALFCDFAETYHILDFYSLPVETAARLAAGLRGNSRIRSQMSGINEAVDTFLLAAMVDLLKHQVWMQTRDGQKGRNKPKRIADKLLIKKKEAVGYSSFDEFDKMRREILG